LRQEVTLSVRRWGQWSGVSGGSAVVETLAALESSKLDTCDVFSLDGSEIIVGSPTALLVGERSCRVRRRKRPIRMVWFDLTSYSTEDIAEGGEGINILCSIHCVNRVEDELTKWPDKSWGGRMIVEEVSQ
jgi:hypothetical protein